MSPRIRWFWELGAGTCFYLRLPLRKRPGLEFRHPELLGCRALRTLGDALCVQEALNAVMQAPDQAGLAVRVAWHVAVDQYLKPQTPVA